MTVVRQNGFALAWVPYGDNFLNDRSAKFKKTVFDELHQIIFGTVTENGMVFESTEIKTKRPIGATSRSWNSLSKGGLFS
jgi:hypothetical protein